MPTRSNLVVLTSEEVSTLTAFLQKKVLPAFRSGERMYPAGTFTDEPDDGTMYRGEDAWRNYSLSYEVLADVIDFLKQAKGPVSFG